MHSLTGSVRFTSLAGFASLALLACSAKREAAPVDLCLAPVQRPQVFGGARASTLSSLTRAQTAAIVGVRVDAPSRSGLCSGIIIAPGSALTARHCIPQEALADAPEKYLELVFGSDLDAPEAETAVTAVSISPSLDVARVDFSPPEAAAFTRPARLATTPLDATWLDSAAEFAGIGLREDGNAGQLAFAVEQIESYDEQQIVVNGLGRSGACVGDSGGPLFARGNDGSLQVIGVLGVGDVTCTDRDYYARADAIAAWLGWPAAEPPSDCDGLDTVGTCVRGRAAWCNEGTLTAQDCSASGEVCGWARRAAGFRCVSPDQDVCQGSGSLRTCQGNRLRYCDATGLHEHDCQSCGVCSDWVDANGAACTRAPSE